MMHEHSVKEFFKYAKKIVLKHNLDGAFLSYIYGFICHFSLDVTCHGYIDKKIFASGISHTEIEAEFDRKLMIQDGFNPITHNLTNHIVISEKNAEIIHYYFKNVQKKEVKIH